MGKKKEAKHFACAEIQAKGVDKRKSIDSFLFFISCLLNPKRTSTWKPSKVKCINHNNSYIFYSRKHMMDANRNCTHH